MGLGLDDFWLDIDGAKIGRHRERCVAKAVEDGHMLRLRVCSLEMSDEIQLGARNGSAELRLEEGGERGHDGRGKLALLSE